MRRLAPRVLAPLALLALLAMPPAAASASIEVFAGASPACPGWPQDPYFSCVFSGAAFHATAGWWFRACSDVPALLTWEAVSLGGANAAGQLVLNGPPGNPLSTGPCHEAQDGGITLLVDCVAIEVEVAPLDGSTPLRKGGAACGLFV